MLTLPKSERFLLPPIVPGEAEPQDRMCGAGRPARQTGQGIAPGLSARFDAASAPAAPRPRAAWERLGQRRGSVAERGESPSQSRV